MTSAFRSYVPGEQHGHRSGDSKSTSLSKLTVSLVSTYQKCNSSFSYLKQGPPRRVLTKPAEPADNNGFDNSNSDLIVAVDDVLVSTGGTRYIVRDTLGHGTFGQVFKCLCEDSGNVVAVKVIKNQPAYFHQARVEIGVLQFLNTRADGGDKHHIVRMQDFFTYRDHLCLVFELLGLNLYELIRHNKYRGLSLPLVKVFINQILDALIVLRDSRIIHCDIKPENVLLKNYESGEIKLIDFGSACFEDRTVYSYIQSRFYRCPEVLLGHPYSMAIDMWSVGCVAAELFLGLPLFPGACEYDLLSRMVNVLGQPPEALLGIAKHTHKYFKTAKDGGVNKMMMGRLRQTYALRSREEFEAFTGQPAPSGKTYFKQNALADIINAYPYRPGLNDEDTAREMQNREAFTDFLLGVLDMNPATRWTPRQAALHPFVTGGLFKGPYQPAPDVAPTSLHSKFKEPGSLTSGGAHPSTAMGMPMSIPRTRQGMTSSTQSWSTPSAADLAAALATSPQVHHQAHAAAMAAVHAQMRRQVQSQGGAPGQDFDMMPGTYNAAHSLSRIVSNMRPVPEAQIYNNTVSYSAPSGMAQSFSAPLLSPPSRSFGPHLHLPNYGSSLVGGSAGMMEYDSAVGSHGVMPLLQGSSQPMVSPMSFQPSSVSTYQAALAAVHAAIHTPPQERTNIMIGQTNTVHGSGLGGNGSGSGSGSGCLQAAVALGTYFDSTPRAAVGGQLPATGAAAAAATPPKWTSLDGSVGTPQAEEPDEAVWDPLWSDDMLKEDEQQEDGGPQATTLAPAPATHSKANGGPIIAPTASSQILLAHAKEAATVSMGFSPRVDGVVQPPPVDGCATIPPNTTEGPAGQSVNGLQLAAAHLSQLQDLRHSVELDTENGKGAHGGSQPPAALGSRRASGEEPIFVRMQGFELGK